MGMAMTVTVAVAMAMAMAAEREAPLVGVLTPPTTQNIVMTCDFEAPFDLFEISSFIGTEFNPKRFAAATLRLARSRTTALLFASGKVVCTGSKSIWSGGFAAAYLVDKLRGAGCSICCSEFTVQNIVCSARVDCMVDLEALARANSSEASYEPELFPGLVYRPSNGKLVVLFFKTGELVITGGRNFGDVMHMFRQARRVVFPHAQPLSEAERTKRASPTAVVAAVQRAAGSSDEGRPAS